MANATDTGKPLTIVSLESNNVKRLKAVRITPSAEGLVVIKGDNGEGKSSVLDSIAYALGGEKLCPPEVIRRGEKSAEVTVDLGDFIVSRRWTPSGSTLKVATPDGAKYSSPQGMLDKLVGTLSFDPLEFARQKPKEQYETLRRLVGIDFSKLEAKRKALYDERTGANARLRDTTAVFEAALHYPDAKPVVVADLLAEQDAIRAKEQEQERARGACEAAAQSVTAGKEWLDEQKGRIAELERQLADARTKLTEGEKRLEQRRAEVVVAEEALAAIAVPEIEPVRAKLASAEEANAQVRANAQRAEAEKKKLAAEAEAKRLTTEIEAIDAEKAKQLGAAKFPIGGLGLAGEGVTFRGVPLEQASQAERIRVSLAIGLALNPRLRVLLIRDASLLDARSLELVAAMAEESGAQLWIERVGTDGEGGVLIEDGEVRG